MYASRNRVNIQLSKSEAGFRFGSAFFVIHKPIKLKITFSSRLTNFQKICMILLSMSIGTLTKHQTEQPIYGNGVSAKLIYIPAALTLAFLVLSILFVLPILIISALFFLPFVYFAYARYRFSPAGGNIQARIQGLVLSYLEWDGEGKAVDIGCGNAPLTIGIAKKYPKAKAVGIDNWGGAWEYSKGVCERNAEIEGVRERVTFKKASASALPLDDEAFDVAVSNLVFHEVRDTRSV